MFYSYFHMITFKGLNFVIMSGGCLIKSTADTGLPEFNA